MESKSLRLPLSYDLDIVMSCPFFHLLFLFFIYSIQDDFLSIFRVGLGPEYGDLMSICTRDVCLTVAELFLFLLLKIS